MKNRILLLIIGIVICTINNAQQPTGTITDVEGNVYKTVQIGNQTWMAENLKTTKYRDGSPIPNVTGSSTWKGFELGAYCWYNNNITYKNPYGALYNWHTISTGNICPTGWHVPADYEWNEITTYLGGFSNAGGPMKEIGTTHWLPPNVGATNSSGFNGLPGGERSPEGVFEGFGDRCGMWTSLTLMDNYVCTRGMFSNNSDLNGGCGSMQSGGASVRCTKDFNIPRVPSITTTPISNISHNSVNTGVIINYDGGNLITLRGLCWDTLPNPDTAKNRTIDRSGTNSFIVNLFNLTPNTTYYIRSYAVNSVGISYGNEFSFKTMPKVIYGSNTNVNGFVSDIDGNNYKTVKIGSQTWMAENLKTTKLNNGTLIPFALGISDTVSIYSSAYYWFNNDSTNKKLYGALYNFYPVETEKLCPIGWHIPIDEEWIILKSFLGDSAVGGKLKEPGFEHWTYPNKGANNTSGFTALPGNWLSDHGGFSDNNRGAWWSATPPNYWYVTAESEDLFNYGENRWGGMSVRCLNDTSNIIAEFPKLTTDTIIFITRNSAVSGGHINYEGGSPVTEKGICWSNSPNPDTTNNKTMDGYGVGNYISNITGLISKTTYYVRAYAINSTGIGYGNELIFTTPEIVYGSVIDIEGNIYKTVKIGSQTWMAENLKTSKYNDGTPIPLIKNNASWASLSTPAYCWYNNDSTTYGETYGVLYNWFTVNTGNLCPTNWHVPTNAEWITLITYIGDLDFAGGKLKETGIEHWWNPNIGATNETGFTALPGGHRDLEGNYGNVELDGLYWTATEEHITDAWIYFMTYMETKALSSLNQKMTGFSVRCIKDVQDTSVYVELQQGLVAYYPFNGNANDESGNGYNGTVNGASLAEDGFGKSNSAYSFNGQDNSITVSGFKVPFSATTIALRVKEMNGNGVEDFISKHCDAGDVEILMRVDNYKYRTYWTIGGTFFTLSDDNGLFTINPNEPKFDFLVLTYDGQRARFYINNIEVASRDITGQIVNNDLPMTIGRYACYNGENLNGVVDDIRIYNRALNTAEITALYNESDTSESRLTNIALNKTVSQSSTQYGGVPERAVDGNTNGDWDNGSVTHTSYEKNAWWEVDLGGTYNISTIELWNRTNSCCLDRLSDFYVFVSDWPFKSRQLDATLHESNVWHILSSDFPDPADTFIVGRTGRYIRIQSAHSVELNIAEVIVMGSLHKPKPVPTNIALNKPVSQSSTQYGGVPEKAVDGNTNGDWNNGSVTHTFYDKNAWWELDLGGIYNISTIELWNRTNSCCNSRLSDFYVFASDEPFSSSQLDATLNQPNVWQVYKSDYPNPADTFMVGRTAKYIRIQSAHSAELNIAEVIVMGSLSERQLGLTNVAQNKPVTQSSTQYGGVPERAVDGNINGDWDNGSVTHTFYDKNAWWELDLGGIYNISTIELWNRTNSCCLARLSDFYVFASDEPFLSSQLDAALNQPNVWQVFRSDYPNPAETYLVGRTARYIRIQSAHSAELNIAEVIVLGTLSEQQFGLTNVAKNKPVTQSSTQYGGVPERAVDGNTNGLWEIGSVTHTFFDQNAWWEVDLGGIYNINTIELWNRTNSCCLARLSEFYVFASEVPFVSRKLNATLNQSNVWHLFAYDYPNPSDIFMVNRTARYIRIQSDHSTELNIAEVVIMGTPTEDIFKSTGKKTGSDVSLQADITIYPVPFSNVIYFESKEIINRIEFLNVLGESLIMQKCGKSSEEINTDFLMPGLYYARILMENGKMNTYTVIKSDR